jgi:hypothetical protein
MKKAGNLNSKTMGIAIVSVALMAGGWIFHWGQGKNNFSAPSVSESIQKNPPGVEGRKEVSEQIDSLEKNKGNSGLLSKTVSGITFPANMSPSLADTTPEQLRQLGNSLVSGTSDEQIDAIKILAKIGTPDQRAIIESYAKNPNKEIGVQLAAVENIDWDRNPETLIGIIKNLNGVSEAAIYMAAAREIKEETRASLDEAVYKGFFQTSRPSTQIAILTYFLEQHHPIFDVIYKKASLENYSAEEMEDMKQMLKQRSQEKMGL